MPWFKCGLVLLPSSYILSLCSKIVTNNTFDTGLIFLYLASGAIAVKIMYDRHQQIHILSSLTPDPNVTSFANKIASFAAFILSLGLLVYLLIYVFKVDNYSVTALNFCLCAFATLYMWMQAITTVYFSTIYYDTNMTALRQCLASFSSVVIVLMAIVGTISLLLSGETSYICLYIASLCVYVVAAIYFIFILSYEKDYRYFAEGFHSDLLLDNECAIDETCSANSEVPQHSRSIPTKSFLIKSGITASKYL